jgi:hypothetical protein
VTAQLDSAGLPTVGLLPHKRFQGLAVNTDMNSRRVPGCVLVTAAPAACVTAGAAADTVAAAAAGAMAATVATAAGGFAAAVAATVAAAS